jgi:hypothetical protein
VLMFLLVIGCTEHKHSSNLSPALTPRAVSSSPESAI